MNYSDLEDIYIQFQKAESDYYSKRYYYWQAINKIKQQSPHKISYKQFEGLCRRLTKKIRKSLLYLKPKKGQYELDHLESILSCYCRGISVEEACSPKNLRWIPKKDNRKKGILSEERFKEINITKEEQ